MDKFPLICTLAVVVVFFAGACGIAGVQNMKLKDDAPYGSSDGARVKSESSFTRGGISSATAEKSGRERLEELLSPRKFEKIGSDIEGQEIEGINTESLRSIKGTMKGPERRLAMERKAIEVRGELLISF